MWPPGCGQSAVEIAPTWPSTETNPSGTPAGAAPVTGASPPPNGPRRRGRVAVSRAGAPPPTPARPNGPRRRVRVAAPTRRAPGRRCRGFEWTSARRPRGRSDETRSWSSMRKFEWTSTHRPNGRSEETCSRSSMRGFEWTSTTCPGGRSDETCSRSSLRGFEWTSARRPSGRRPGAGGVRDHAPRPGGGDADGAVGQSVRTRPRGSARGARCGSRRGRGGSRSVGRRGRPRTAPSPA